MGAAGGVGARGGVGFGGGEASSISVHDDAAIMVNPAAASRNGTAIAAVRGALGLRGINGPSASVEAARPDAGRGTGKVHWQLSSVRHERVFHWRRPRAVGAGPLPLMVSRVRSGVNRTVACVTSRLVVVLALPLQATPAV